MITVHWDSYKYIMQLSIYSEKFTCNELEKIFWLPVDNVFKKWDRYKDSNILYQKNEIRINYKWEYDDISIDKYFEYILYHKVKGAYLSRIQKRLWISVIICNLCNKWTTIALFVRNIVSIMSILNRVGYRSVY